MAGDGRIEKAAVNFTHSIGNALPSAASSIKKGISGLPFEAVSLSLIVHPSNPFVPTTHMNVRLFTVGKDSSSWHFGGGYDLTPTYGFVSDAKLWHLGAKEAARDLYENMKQNCDEYFFLLTGENKEALAGYFSMISPMTISTQNFASVRRIAESFLPLYEKIFRKRTLLKFTEQNRAFQLYRRGRYAEFNLLEDRGTKYGLQSGRNVENVLSSMPPLASWVYKFPIEENSPEDLLTKYFLTPQDWISMSDSNF